jgi:SAM-dependent methyltransferase
MNKAEPAALIDFGCGDMPYRSLFKAYVGTYIGADLPDNPAADLPITVGHPLAVPNASVEYVLSSQVLEHVLDPTAYLQECWRILKPDGLLILSTHGHYQYHPHPTDLWRWTSAGLQKVITDQGFHIEEFRGLAGIGATSVSFLQYAFMQNVRLRSVQPLMSFILQHLMWLLDSLWRNPARDTDALVYLLVARKVNNHNAG